MAKDVIARLKADTSHWDSGLSRAGRSLEQLQQKNISLDAALQGSVKTLTSVAAKYVGWGAAAAGAMKVAKDAFMNTEQGIDSWGRTVSSAEGAYNTFLSTINGGNWTNFFTNLQEAVRGAADLYDKLDRLGSIKSNNVAAIAIKEQALAQSRLQLQEAKSKGDKAQMAALEETIKQQSKDLADLRKMESNQGKVAGRAQITEAMKAIFRGDANLNGVQINDATWNRVADNIAKDGQKYMDAYYKWYKDLTAKGMETRTTARGSFATGDYRTETEQYFNINKLTEEEKKRYAIAKAATEAETQIQKGLSTYANAVNQETSSNNQQFRYNRMAGAGSGSGGNSSSSSSRYSSGLSGISDIPGLAFGATKSMKELNEELARYKKMKEEATTSFEYNEAIEGIEQVQKEIAVQPITLQLGVDAEKIVPIQEIINNFFKEHPITPEMKLPTNFFPSVSKSAEDTANAWKEATRAISNAGNAMTNLEDPSAKVAGIVMQAIANIALGFAQASASPATGLAGVFGWIAAVTAGVATMTATIAQIKSATEYHAQGGMVGTSPFIPKGTDTVPAMLTPGEIVLNAAQQRNMANNLQGTSNVVMQSSGESRISGEDIITVINAYGRRTGRGEILV